MKRSHCNFRVCWPVVLAVALAACAPSATVQPRGDLDAAVARYIQGDYKHAAERLRDVATNAPDNATRREAYTYLGRACMAMGDTEGAIDAFRMGIEYGDRGPCVDYLQMMQRFQEGSPEGLHILEAVTRGELAGAAVRVLGDGTPLDPTGPTPLEIVERQGWMPAMPDGNQRAGEPVTRAALYSLVARVLAQSGLAGHATDVMSGGYRAAAVDTTAVSGSEAITVLERVRALRDQNGR